MDLQHMREFVGLSQHASFRSAAKALYISQPTLGKHVAALEAELGCALVEREPQMRLTPAGRYFLDRAVSLLSQVDAETADIAEKTRRLSESLVELAFPDFSRTIPGYAEAILSAKARFEAERAPLRLDLDSVDIFNSRSIDQAASLEEVLAGGALDWMAHISSPSRGEEEVRRMFAREGLVCFKVSSSPCKLVVQADHPLAGRGDVSLEELAAYPFLCNRFPECYYSSYARAIEDELRSHGVSAPMERPCQKSSPLNSWGGGQRLGDCVAPTPELAFSFLGFYDQSRNVVLRVRDFEMRFDFYCVYRPEGAAGSEGMAGPGGEGGSEGSAAGPRGAAGRGGAEAPKAAFMRMLEEEAGR